jgi:hypothetical protein
VCSCDGKDTGGEQAIPLSLAEPAPPQRPGSFPSWAEDGRAIIFESRNEIMRLDARAPAKPPRSLASGTEPEVSPDGRFVAHLNDALGLSVLELSTGKRRQVVGRMGGVTTAFAWSPDSEQLAYPGLLPSRPPNVGFVEALFVVGRDGKGRRQLTPRLESQPHTPISWRLEDPPGQQCQTKDRRTGRSACLAAEPVVAHSSEDCSLDFTSRRW